MYSIDNAKGRVEYPLIFLLSFFLLEESSVCVTTFLILQNEVCP